MLTAQAPRHRPAEALVPAAASTLAPAWLHGSPTGASVVAAFPTAAYLRREDGDDADEVLAVLAPDALALPGGVRVASAADLTALAMDPGDRVVVGEGQVVTRTGRLSVRRAVRPARVVAGSLDAAGAAALQAVVAQVLARPGHALDEPGANRDELAALAAAALDRPGPVDRGAVRGLVGLGPGLTPAGDDVLCGLLLGLRATGREDLRADLWAATAPLLPRTPALSATLLRQAALGYAVPPVLNLLRQASYALADTARTGDPVLTRDPASHGNPALAAAALRVAAIGHTSGPALLLGLSTAVAPATHPAPAAAPPAAACAAAPAIDLPAAAPAAGPTRGPS